MPTVTGMLQAAGDAGPDAVADRLGQAVGFGMVRSWTMASKPPTEYAVITNCAPAGGIEVVVGGDVRPPPRSDDVVATACTTGRLSGAVSMRTTSLSASGGVLTKSKSRRGVQWALPPPMMAIRGVMSPPTSPLLKLDVETGVSPYPRGRPLQGGVAEQ